jgi:hypothetical protein
MPPDIGIERPAARDRKNRKNCLCLMMARRNDVLLCPGLATILPMEGMQQENLLNI